jgi:hypothetical protein
MILLIVVGTIILIVGRVRVTRSWGLTGSRARRYGVILIVLAVPVTVLSGTVLPSLLSAVQLDSQIGFRIANLAVMALTMIGPALALRPKELQQEVHVDSTGPQPEQSMGETSKRKRKKTALVAAVSYTAGSVFILTSLAGFWPEDDRPALEIDSFTFFFVLFLIGAYLCVSAYNGYYGVVPTTLGIASLGILCFGVAIDVEDGVALTRNMIFLYSTFFLSGVGLIFWGKRIHDRIMRGTSQTQTSPQP